jgi:hypothetical protein
MARTFTIQQVAKATQMTKYQISAWISRGHFRPQHDAEPGKAREFTMKDIIRLGTAIELVRLGIDPVEATVATQVVYGLTDDIAFLVLSQGPVVLPTMKRADGQPFIDYDLDRPMKLKKIIGSRQLTEFLLNPEKRACAVVNIDEVEKRVKAALETDA